MRKTTFHALLSAGLLLVSPLAAPAAALGKLTVLSAPGAPLEALIDLTGVQIGDTAGLKARLANPQAYEQAHVRYAPILKTLSLALVTGADGAPFLKLTSPQPIEAPDFNVLIELNSGGGQVHEFSVALDQSGANAVPVTVVTAPAGQEAAAAKPAAMARPAVPHRVAEKPGKVKVQRGDTLYGIAQPRLAPGESLSQLVVAIYQANPQGFTGKNMNRMLAGRVLTMPSREAVAAVKPAEALKIIRQQVQSWHAYEQQLAAHAGLHRAPAHAGTQGASGKIEAATRDQGAATAAPPQDVLRLSRGAAIANGASADAVSRKDKAAALQEEKIAREKSVREEEDRIKALKKNIGEMKQLLAVNEPNLAHMQQQAQTVPPKAPVKKAAVPPAKAKPAAAPQQDMRRKAALAALGVAVLALLGVVLLLVRRRRDSSEEVERAVPELEAPLAEATVAEAPAVAAAPAPEAPPAVLPQDPLMLAELYLAQQRVDQAEEVLTNALTQDASRTDIQLKLLELHAMRGNVAAYEALARQYQANHAGRKAEQWRQICAQGREIDPDNRLYATGLEAAMDGEVVFEASPAVAGLVMDPPLGMAAGQAPDAVTETAPDAGVTAAEPAASAALAEAAPASTPEAATEAATEEASAGEAPEEAPVEEQTLAFSLDEIPSFTDSVAADAPAAAAPQAEAAPAMPAGGIDLDLNFRLDAAAEGEAPAPAGTAVAEEPAVAEAGFAAINLDLEVPAAGAADVSTEADAAAESGEIATKLDLARAYIEMGDVTGAREILEEVLTEADGDQLAEARMLWEKSR